MRQVDIKGFEDYQITDDGRVWSKKTNKWRKFRKDKDGYLRFSVHQGKKTITLKVHRLVAETFIPNPEGKTIVGHLKKLPDGTEDKTANEYYNLAWMTVGENNAYGTRTERAAKSMIGKSHKGIINREDESIPVCQFSKEGVLIDEFSSINDAARKYGVVMQAISNCCRGKSKTSCGYIYKYKNDQPN